jgi:Mn-containing catalase
LARVCTMAQARVVRAQAQAQALAQARALERDTISYTLERDTISYVLERDTFSDAAWEIAVGSLKGREWQLAVGLLGTMAQARGVRAQAQAQALAQA